MRKSIFALILLVITSLHTSAEGGTNDTLRQPVPADQISIMTYNVKFLPRGAVSIHHHPVKRARLIPAKLINENPDVIVFQEAFDGKAIRVLTRGLKDKYPYIEGSQNRRLVTYKRAGGVLIFSKYPLSEIESIRYSECKGIDCYGNKGAILVEVQHPLYKFQLLGTHMQAGGSSELKTSQYHEAGELLKRHQVSGTPQFIAGDFNTHNDDTTLYPKLVSELQAQDGAIEDESKVLSDHTYNDMRMKNGVPKKKKGVIDYVFIRENGVKIKTQSRYARSYQQVWDSGHKDLSDHFAVILTVTL